MKKTAKKLMTSLLAATGIVAMSGFAFGAVTTFTNLVISSADNGTGSAATGVFNGSYDDATGLLTWSATWNNLEGTITTSHFHGPAVQGANGGVLVGTSPPIPTGAGTTSGSAGPEADDFSGANEAHLLGGLVYLNIHTSAHGGGEIRVHLIADAPLSVSMSEFAGNYRDGNVNLNWITSSEDNNTGFNIYRTKTNEMPKTENVFMSYKNFPALRSQNSNSASEQNYSISFPADKDYYYWVADVDFDNVTTIYDESVLVRASVINEGSKNLRYKLKQNYPNPFNPSTTISFSLTNDANVSLDIYNTKGQLINTLVSNEKYAGGNEYNVNWNGTDSNGKSVSSGVYFYKLKANDFTDIKKAVFLK
ncbi:MAG: CHRD domain-containing protein [Calditrichaeota bacterium]|nr:MAG: CHRD domain-containing protein [Calditrichota bacterium]